MGLIFGSGVLRRRGERVYSGDRSLRSVFGCLHIIAKKPLIIGLVGQKKPSEVSQRVPMDYLVEMRVRTGLIDSHLPVRFECSFSCGDGTGNTREF